MILILKFIIFNEILIKIVFSKKILQIPKKRIFKNFINFIFLN